MKKIGFIDTILQKIKAVGRPTFSMYIQAVFLLMMAVDIAAIIYSITLRVLPTKYVLLSCVVLFLYGGVQVFLLLQKRAPKAFGLVSLVMSILSILVAVVIVYFLWTFQQTVSSLPEEQEEVSVETPSVVVDKEPFIVYLSGMDTRGNVEIQERGLSDVNMFLVVNPQTKTLLMVNIPRDYYVPLYGDTNKMDKLTHAGTYGIDCSIKTLNSLFGIKCNYYVKVNFKSVVDIVDALGKITVTSDFDFSSKYSLSGTRYSFVKGENVLNGDQALAFARERHSFELGDRQRGIHQQKVIKAVMNKAMSPSILNPKNLKNILNGITENTKTNISYEDIADLIRMQLNDMSSWTFKTVSVDGSGTSRPSYASGGEVLYVMIPNMKTVEAAKAEIEAVMK